MHQGLIEKCTRTHVDQAGNLADYLYCLQETPEPLTL